MLSGLELESEGVYCVMWVTGPIVSSLTEYFGARAVTVVGGILMFLGYIGAALSDDLFTLSLTFGLVLGGYSS